MGSGDGSDSWSDQDGWETAADDGETERGADGKRDHGGERRHGGNGEEGDGSGDEGEVIARARWLATTDHEAVAFVREVASSLAIVAAIGLLLFAVSGLWPPMVAIESESMSPNLKTGDLVFVMEEHRFAGGAAQAGTGVVGYRAGEQAGYKEFHKYGDVIVYEPDGNGRETPIIHRARFWVNDGENWYDKANQEYLGGAGSCEALTNCPAPHDGFITKGDNNGQYDQVGGGFMGPISAPVKPSWITGTAEFRIPWLGEIRLLFGMVSTGASALAETATTATTAAAAGFPIVGALAGVGIFQAAR
ncbi:S26 family signal peptidase [Halococcus sp. PRR34]|uniref:S26 family signal peptidase n=1 Tax=Halococcus sp. PRR34 TaxID=3020830 RepID=UPI002362481F|nr:S26 family signal peptidase [Halococcus sp. PRR34]